MTLVLLSACNKSKDCRVTIHCKDNNGANIENARVQLFAKVKTEGNGTIIADMKAEGSSDREGNSIFVFKLPAIYDVKVTSGAKSGTSIVKLEEGKTVSENIIIQ